MSREHDAPSAAKQSAGKKTVNMPGTACLACLSAGQQAVVRMQQARTESGTRGLACGRSCSGRGRD